MSQPERVVIAMSGGVDSSVAAALLVKQGYQVIGMMMRLWNEIGHEQENRCCTPDAIAQARKVAGILGIPFYVIDAKEPFYNQVVLYFLDSLEKSLTPNPCLVCNKFIRWEYLLQKAVSAGAQYLATGHYVRITNAEDGLYQVKRAVDPDKDQSYVLYSMNQEKLSRALFPIGEYTKAQIRQIAHEVNLPVAERPDSQDLCFIGHSSYQDFLVRNAPHLNQPGPILTQDGNEIGQHQGLAFYTIGQRKGLGIANPVPLYVISKNIKTNALIVGIAEELGKKSLLAKNIHWISGNPPDSPFRGEIKIRYKAPLAPGLIIPMNGGNFRIDFDYPLRDITPGQAAVIYNEDVCLGGGIIEQALP